MVGAGVLSLPSAMSWLGWVGGLLSLLLFYGISLWCSLMLTSVYKVNGRRHPTYSDAVLGVLGRRSSRVLVVVQRVMLLLAAIGYQIAAADCLTYIANSGCDAAASRQGCGVKHWHMTLAFGGEPVLLLALGQGGLGNFLAAGKCGCCSTQQKSACAPASKHQTLPKNLSRPPTCLTCPCLKPNRAAGAAQPAAKPGVGLAGVSSGGRHEPLLQHPDHRAGRLSGPPQPGKRVGQVSTGVSSRVLCVQCTGADGIR